MSPGRSKAALPALALLVNASIWGLSWYPFKVLAGRGLHPLWTTAAVFTGALVVLLVVRPTSLASFFRNPRLLLMAVAAGLTNVCFIWGVTIGDVVRVTLLFYLMPVWSVGVAWVVLHERPNRAALLRLVLALVGVVLVLHVPGTALPLPQGLADFLALAGGFCFALTNVLVRRWRDAPEAGRAAAMFVGGFAMSTLLALSGIAAVPLPVQSTWAPWVAALSVAYVVSNLALQYGAARLPAHVTAVIMLVEILIATVSSSLAGAAHPTPAVFLGGAFILAAALLSVRRS